MRFHRVQNQAVAIRRHAAGFSLIELLLSLVVIGILGTIIIPNMLSALDKSRQKRTMADLRGLSGGIEAYSVDNGFYPSGSGISTLDILVPEYVRSTIETDGWNHQLIYEGSPLQYSLGSTGKDGGNVLTLNGSGGATNSFDDDIIFALGRFVQWPEGTQN